jgi:hypothetical protein
VNYAVSCAVGNSRVSWCLKDRIGFECEGKGEGDDESEGEDESGGEDEEEGVNGGVR